jgi:hypothetical protein
MNTSNLIIGVNGSTAWNEEGCGKMVALFTSLARGLDVGYIHTQIDGILKDVGDSQLEKMMEDLVVLAYQSRDIRGGKGERMLFYNLFSGLVEHVKKLDDGAGRLKRLVKLVGEYGCWNDLWSIMRLVPLIQDIVIDVVVGQFADDEAGVVAGKSISLLAKWMPRERGGDHLRSSASQRENRLDTPVKTDQNKLVDMIRTRLGVSRKDYRKRVAALNKHLKTVEINMCGGTWADIDPNGVPGRNMHLHKKAFLNENSKKLVAKLMRKHGSALYSMRASMLAELRQKHELRYPYNEDRMKCRQNFIEFFGKVAKGEEKMKGADALMPHEIVKAVDAFELYYDGDPEMQALEGQWKAVSEKFDGKLNKMICLADFSGSMEGLPMLISMALGILISEKTAPAFRNKLITFDSNPSWIDFKETDNLYEKVKKCRASPWGGSTNFEAAYELVLQRMIDGRVEAGAEPDDLVVLTDMGWNQATSGHAFNLDALKAKFKSAGEELWGEGKGWKVPRVIIWNLREQFKQYQATENTPGVVMISGWHPSVLKRLIEGVEITTPWDGLRWILDAERYDPVRKAFSAAVVASSATTIPPLPDWVSKMD